MIAQKMSMKSHQKMFTKCHPKRGLLVDKSVHEMSPKVSRRCHLCCPRDVTYYVHEMSATHIFLRMWNQPFSCFQYEYFNANSSTLWLCCRNNTFLLGNDGGCTFRDYATYWLYISKDIEGRGGKSVMTSAWMTING